MKFLIRNQNLQVASYTFLTVALLGSLGFAQDYNASTRAFPRPDIYPGHCTSSYTGSSGVVIPPKYCVYFSPDDMPIHAVGGELLKAEKKIEISTYNMDVLEFVPLLLHKLNQGVKVEFGVDFVRSKTANAVWRALPPHKNLKKYRVPVLRGRMPQMHNKIVIIEDKVLITGSANFSYSGLVHNYENVMVVRERSIVEKFQQEVQEMREQSLAACRAFTRNPQTCDSGHEDWDQGFAQLAESGSTQHLLKPEAKGGEGALSAACEPVRERGFLTQFNQPHALSEGKTYRDCFIDERYAKLAQEFSKIERFHDGKSVRDLITTGEDPGRYLSPERGYPRTYFSPEDNVQSLINFELRQTLPRAASATEPARPPFQLSDSYVYVGTNFITNRSFATTLVDLYNRGVDLLIWFDRGRFDDPMFQQALSVLRPLGFSRGEGDNSAPPQPRVMPDGALAGGPESEKEDQAVLKVFDYQLTGPYGAYHHKFAVVGNSFGVKLINGSANWSANAVRRNDENVMVIRDEELASIFVANYLSNLFVYHFGQNYHSAGFQREVGEAFKRLPCTKPLLGFEGASECTLRFQPPNNEGRPVRRWTPGLILANKAFAVEQVPIDSEKENLWAWVPQLNENRGGFVQFFTHGFAAGRWLATIPMRPGWAFEVKLFKAAKGFNPYQGCGRLNLAECVPSEAWEWAGYEKQRWLNMPLMGVQTVDRVYTWGQL